MYRHDLQVQPKIHQPWNSAYMLMITISNAAKTKNCIHGTTLHYMLVHNCANSRCCCKAAELPGLPGNYELACEPTDSDVEGVGVTSQLL